MYSSGLRDSCLLPSSSCVSTARNYKRHRMAEGSDKARTHICTDTYVHTRAHRYRGAHRHTHILMSTQTRCRKLVKVQEMPLLSKTDTRVGVQQCCKTEAVCWKDGRERLRQDYQIAFHVCQCSSASCHFPLVLLV